MIKLFFIILGAALVQMTIVAASSWHGAAPNILPAVLAVAAFETGAYHLLLPGVLAAGIALDSLSVLPFGALMFALVTTVGALAIAATFLPHRALWHCMIFSAVAAAVYDGATAIFAYSFAFVAGNDAAPGIDIGLFRVARDILVVFLSVAILYPFRAFLAKPALP
ncbi:MAG: hypothetical protein AAB581_03285 [Patescibacteria group bacterium]